MSSAKERTRALNDALRQYHTGGAIVVTAGVRALDGDVIRQIDRAVSSFDRFDDHNDPHGEHDFGLLTVGGICVIFKIDYYEPTMTSRSDRPNAPLMTQRVMTIMLAEEY